MTASFRIVEFRGNPVTKVGNPASALPLPNPGAEVSIPREPHAPQAPHKT